MFSALIPQGFVSISINGHCTNDIAFIRFTDYIILLFIDFSYWLFLCVLFFDSYHKVFMSANYTAAFK